MTQILSTAAVIIMIFAAPRLRQLRHLMLLLYFCALIWFTLVRSEAGTGVYLIPLERVIYWIPRYIHAYGWQGALRPLAGIYLNILLFIPFGYLVHMSFGPPIRFIIMAAFLLSLTIELIQYFAQLGMLEMDDLINNTLGACIGAWIHTRIEKHMKRAG